MRAVATSSDLALAVSGLRFAYPGHDPVFDGFNLKVRCCSVHCLLGPSGCGKSTLLRLISGLERPAAGVIRFRDRAVFDAGTNIPPERRRVGLVFQDLALFPNMSVRRNVTFGMRSTPRSQRRDAADELLCRVGLADYASRMPHTLSGGQQQRVAIARALASRPDVMLLDEPFSSLDTGLRKDLREELLSLLRLSGVGTLMVTHDDREACEVGDEITWLGLPGADNPKPGTSQKAQSPA
ncbi:MAG: ABC transporter ATP-binding protein [bacterium]|nr:ABC transporter ATP-binding protein [bacterium]